MYLKVRPEARKKIYLQSEWEKVPYHVGLFIAVGLVACFGAWWETSRIHTIEYVPVGNLRFKGMLGNVLVEFPFSEITEIDEGARSHKIGTSKTYQLTFRVRGREFNTRDLTKDERYQILQGLQSLKGVPK